MELIYFTEKPGYVGIFLNVWYRKVVVETHWGMRKPFCECRNREFNSGEMLVMKFNFIFRCKSCESTRCCHSHLLLLLESSLKSSSFWEKLDSIGESSFSMSFCDNKDFSFVYLVKCSIAFLSTFNFVASVLCSTCARRNFSVPSTLKLFFISFLIFLRER